MIFLDYIQTAFSLIILLLDHAAQNQKKKIPGVNQRINQQICLYLFVAQKLGALAAPQFQINNLKNRIMVFKTEKRLFFQMQLGEPVSKTALNNFTSSKLNELAAPPMCISTICQMQDLFFLRTLPRGIGMKRRGWWW